FRHPDVLRQAPQGATPFLAPPHQRDRGPTKRFWVPDLAARLAMRQSPCGGSKMTGRVVHRCTSLSVDGATFADRPGPLPDGDLRGLTVIHGVTTQRLHLLTGEMRWRWVHGLYAGGGMSPFISDPHRSESRRLSLPTQVPEDARRPE